MPPNNWLSFFAGPAWTWNHRREQYYLHQFLSCQPNLNLRNPAVQAAHQKQMRFWRDRGVDGFRMDAVSAYLHDTTLTDNPPSSAKVQQRASGPAFNPYTYQDHQFDLLPGDGAAFCETVRSWVGEDSYLMGEINSGNKSITLANAFTEDGRLNAAYTIDLAERGMTPAVIADVLDQMAGVGRLGFWLSSHDQARHVTNLGDGSINDAKFLALAAAVLPGPPMVYQGEELGLPQPDLKHHEVTDRYDLKFWPDRAGREGARVPIPWTDDAPHFGFSAETPWLPMRWDGATQCVVSQEADDASVLTFYRDLLHARKRDRWADASIIRHETQDQVLRLELAGQKSFVVVLNFGDDTAENLDLPKATPIIASVPDPDSTSLPARSGAIWALSDDKT